MARGPQRGAGEVHHRCSPPDFAALRLLPVEVTAGWGTARRSISHNANSVILEHDRKTRSSGTLPHSALDRGSAACGGDGAQREAQSRDRTTDRAQAEDSRWRELA